MLKQLPNTTAVQFECSGDPGSKEIAPLILITYIENAFKYAINPDINDCIVEVTFQVTDTGMRLYVFNKKIQHSAEADSTGIGVNNTSDRLKHLAYVVYSIKKKEKVRAAAVIVEMGDVV